MDFEIFKLLEATIANVHPGHIGNKDLRRDQLLVQYDEAEKTIQSLIKAKEHEITYRKDLIDMLDKCKIFYDTKMMRARHAYQAARKHASESLNLHRTTTTPPLPPPQNNSNKNNDLNTTNSSTGSSNISISYPIMTTQSIQQQRQPVLQQTLSGYTMMPVTEISPQKSGDQMDMSMASDNFESRSSLDRRLSEFLKTFPNLAQPGIANTSGDSSDVKPLPGYYTQQPTSQMPGLNPAPPMMAMLRFPPPNMAPPPVMHPVLNHATIQVQENNDTADMDLSDHDESNNSNNIKSNTNLIPMVASAIQQGSGGPKQNSQYLGNQHYNNASVPYAPRLNPLAFDPSIIDPGLSSADGSKSESKPSNRQRHGSGSSSSSGGLKQSSDKHRYSSSSSASHSSSRSKRR